MAGWHEEAGDAALAAAGWLRRRFVEFPAAVQAEAVAHIAALERVAGVGIGPVVGRASDDFEGAVE